MSSDINDEKGVTRIIKDLEPGFGKMVELLRNIVIDSNPSIGQQIKWNSPSFFYTGAMKPFNPKEYKRDIVVFNLRKNIATLVFPTGAKIENNNGLLQGNYTDGRRIAVFKHMDEVANRANDLQLALNDWIKKVE